MVAAQIYEIVFIPFQKTPIFICVYGRHGAVVGGEYYFCYS